MNIRSLPFPHTFFLRKKEYFTIGSVPTDEKCTQAGGDREFQLLECKIYAKQFLREFGPLPPFTDFFILKNVHDAGIYYDLAVEYLDPEQFDEENETADKSLAYALKVEGGLSNWDEISLKELQEKKHPLYFTPVIVTKFKETA